MKSWITKAWETKEDHFDLNLIWPTTHAYSVHPLKSSLQFTLWTTHASCRKLSCSMCSTKEFKILETLHIFKIKYYLVKRYINILLIHDCHWKKKKIQGISQPFHWPHTKWFYRNQYRLSRHLRVLFKLYS